MFDDKRIAVIDGQGGGIGKAIVDKLRKAFGKELHIIALGTNSAATNQMMKAGADEGATGENAVAYNVARVDCIVGVTAILMANGLMGELTPRMAEAIGASDAVKILIPLERCGIRIAGSLAGSVQSYVERAVEIVGEEMGKK